MQCFNINKKEQEILYYELLEGYDLIQEIAEEIENTQGIEPETRMNMVEPVINQMVSSLDVIIEKYASWIKNGMHAKQSDIKEVEKAIRMVFSKSTDFIKTVQDLPDTINDESKNTVTNIMETVRKVRKKILPAIGEGPEEIMHGPVGESFFEEIKRMPIIAKLINKVKNAMDHFFRITYCFFHLENCLISNPNNVIWGRKLPDIKTKAMLEQQKSEGQKKKIKSNNFQQHTDRVLFNNNKSREI